MVAYYENELVWVGGNHPRLQAELEEMIEKFMDKYHIRGDAWEFWTAGSELKAALFREEEVFVYDLGTPSRADE